MNNISSAKFETGVIHGRFQVLHNDHLKYLLAGKALCRHLVIGITNPDPASTRQESSDPNRHSLFANPLSYYERYLLVKSAMTERGIGYDEFSIVPLPISMPELYRYYVPMDAIFFLTIYDEWGRQKLKYFNSLGLKTHILWEVPPDRKGISADDVRKLMADGKSWEHLIPQSAASLMKKWNIAQRLRKISETDMPE